MVEYQKNRLAEEDFRATGDEHYLHFTPGTAHNPCVGKTPIPRGERVLPAVPGPPAQGLAGAQGLESALR